jgi:hypothetical protein
MDVAELPPAFEQVRQLGPVETAHRSTPRRVDKSYLLLAAAMIVFAAIGYGAYQNQNWFIRRRMEGVSISLIIGSAIGLLACGAWTLNMLMASALNSATYRKRSVAVYRDGLADFCRGKLRVWRWEDVREIVALYITGAYMLDQAPVAARFEIHYRDGDELVVDHRLTDYAVFVKRVENGVYPHIAAEMNRVFATRGQVAFSDKLSVAPDGVRSSGKLIPWNQLGGYKVEAGHLHLPGIVEGLRVGDIPNFTLLMQLFAQKASRTA